MNKILIITYHYVRNYQKEFPNLKILNFTKFKKQLDFIVKNYNVIDYFKILQYLKNNQKFPKNSCWLTFDDGYLDHYKFVLPELKKRNLKASFFPVAKSAQYNIILEVNKIQLILSKSKNPNILFNKIEKFILEKFNEEKYQKFKKKYFIRNKYDDVKTSFIKKILQYGMPDKYRIHLINSLFKEIAKLDEKKFSKKLYMKKSHLKKLISSGMHIGGHGFNHLRLGLSSKSIQEREIKITKKFLKSIGAKYKNWLMCYPYGNYNNITKKILKNHGCKMALTVEDKIANFNNIDLLQVPRIDTNKLKSIRIT